MALTDDPAAYCRSVESYVCQKNDGHLVRIVGPAFDKVKGWAERGIPLKVVYRAIDRYFERYYGKGPQRRPVRVEFCEADVLDLFDEWRRSVGITDPPDADGERESRPRESLAAHLDKLVARLTTRRGGADRLLDQALDDIVREIDTLRTGAKGIRGDRREAVLQRLRVLDQQLLASGRQTCAGDTLREIAAEADAQLAPFRDRMASDVYSNSHRACVDRLIRERLQLPAIAFD